MNDSYGRPVACCRPIAQRADVIEGGARPVLFNLQVVYLIFNEGYAATCGENWIRPELCAEAERLGRLLAALMPQQIEVQGAGRADGTAGVPDRRSHRAGWRAGPAHRPGPAALGPAARRGSRRVHSCRRPDQQRTRTRTVPRPGRRVRAAERSLSQQAGAPRFVRNQRPTRRDPRQERPRVRFHIVRKGWATRRIRHLAAAKRARDTGPAGRARPDVGENRETQMKRR